MEPRRIPFSREDEEAIASAGAWGILIAVTSAASALLGAVFVLATVVDVPGARWARPTVLVGAGLSTAIAVLLGVWLFQAGVAFRKVARSDEGDRHYLLLGFARLRNYFMTIGIVIIAFMVVAGVFVLGTPVLMLLR